MEVLCKLLYPTLYPVHDPAAGPWGMPDERGNIQARRGGRGEGVHEGATLLPRFSVSQAHCVQLPLPSSAYLPLLILSPPFPQLPLPAPASLPLLSEAGVYLIDNGRLLMLWVGRAVSRDWTLDVSVCGTISGGRGPRGVRTTAAKPAPLFPTPMSEHTS